MPGVPHNRIRTLNAAPVCAGGDWILYWMTSFRRARWNFSLDRAIEHAQALGKPLVVLEALRCDYPWASDRLHDFVLRGMRDNARRFAKSPVTYLPYVEPTVGAGKGLLEKLAARACVVVGDDWPCFFIPAMQRAAAERIGVSMEVVDSNGLLPMHSTERLFTTARSFRLHLQKVLPPFLLQVPKAEPLTRLSLPAAKVPKEITARWRRASDALLEARPSELAKLPIDHSLGRTQLEGGSAAGEARLKWFVQKALAEYAERRSEPEVDGTSKFSPWLHYGHISTHQVLHEIARQANWSARELGASQGGSREGWWQLPPATEAFLDELVTWRELAFNASSHLPDDFMTMSSLPSWAVASLKKHEKDRREYRYSLDALKAGHTHDALWNAAQTQLVREGWFHNALRMLWGKKILEWSDTPQQALDTMEALMNRYSLDGRDPCSYAGALWVLGRYDRPWGPERPIFGNVRYMSSANSARKWPVKNFIAKYAPNV